MVIVNIALFSLSIQEQKYFPNLWHCIYVYAYVRYMYTTPNKEREYPTVKMSPESNVTFDHSHVMLVAILFSR